MFNVYVAPFAGAWIEILETDFAKPLQQMSLPSRERGLKFCRYHILMPAILVAPFAGAWIEIVLLLFLLLLRSCRSLRGSVD